MKTLKKYLPLILAALAFIAVLFFLQPAPKAQVVVAARDLPAGHAKNDIPSVLNTYGAQHNIEMHYGRELGVDY